MAPTPKHSPDEQEQIILNAAVTCIEQSSILDFTMVADESVEQMVKDHLLIAIEDGELKPDNPFSDNANKSALAV